MKILGICGQSGAGKTTALNFFLEYSRAFVIDCDEVSRFVMKKGEDCYLEVLSNFGHGILFENGEIDRKKLGKIAFLSREKLALLTEITHRHIKKEIFKRLEKARVEGFSLSVIDAPLLFESGLDRICDITLAIVATKKEKLSRIIKRDGIENSLAEKRFENQIDEKILTERADEVIDNSSTLSDFEEKIKDFIKRRGLEA